MLKPLFLYKTIGTIGLTALILLYGLTSFAATRQIMVPHYTCQTPKPQWKDYKIENYSGHTLLVQLELLTTCWKPGQKDAAQIEVKIPFSLTGGKILRFFMLPDDTTQAFSIFTDCQCRKLPFLAITPQEDDIAGCIWERTDLICK